MADVMTAQKVAARTEDAVKVYGKGQTEVRALDGVTVEFAAGRFTADHGPVRLGQVDAAALRGRAGHPHVGPGLHRRRRPEHPQRPAADHPAARPRRLRVPGLQPGADAHRRGEHHPPAAARRPQGRPGVDQPGHRDHRHRRPAAAPAQTSCPAASSSGSRWPGPWPAGPRSSSPTSPPATWTPGRAPRCSTSCAGPWTRWARPSSWSPTTRSRPATPTASCSWPTGGSSTRCSSRRPTGCWSG